MPKPCTSASFMSRVGRSNRRAILASSGNPRQAAVPRLGAVKTRPDRTTPGNPTEIRRTGGNGATSSRSTFSRTAGGLGCGVGTRSRSVSMRPAPSITAALMPEPPISIPSVCGSVDRTLRGPRLAGSSRCMAAILSDADVCIVVAARGSWNAKAGGCDPRPNRHRRQFRSCDPSRSDGKHRLQPRAEPAELSPVSIKERDARATARGTVNPSYGRYPMTALKRLLALGQSVWLDDLSRHLIRTGELSRLVEDGVRGVTSNPSTFHKAIAGSSDYESDVLQLAMSGGTPAGIFEELMTADVRSACDVFRPVFDESRGTDGFVSLEVSPHLAHDTQGSIEQAKRLWVR